MDEDLEKQFAELYKILKKSQVAILHLQSRELALQMAIGEFFKLSEDHCEAFRLMTEKHFKVLIREHLILGEKIDPSLVAELSDEIDPIEGLE